MQAWFTSRGHDIAVIFSESSRQCYADHAARIGETYSFDSAWDRRVTWLKGEYAYLAPNGASLLLSRCNLKHDLIGEALLTDQVLAGYRLLLIPNAAHLPTDAIAAIERWHAQPDCRLMVTGRSNLPPALLGLATNEPLPLAGWTGWRWRDNTRFGNEQWQPAYVAGYCGHLAQRVTPASGSRVLADLLEFSGDLSDASTATTTEHGAAIVATDRTVYVATQVFELIGGMMQAHLNVEAVRHWANPTHWGDTLLLFLRELLLGLGAGDLWNTRLRSFGAHDGVLTFRHDVHGMTEFSMLDYQGQNLIAASWDIEDPAFSTNITEDMAKQWVARTKRYGFLEPALHNDSSIGDPPTAIFGKGLFTHVDNAGRNLGIRVCTCGRHAGGHMHPETIDAMDYLYANSPDLIGACTFSYYHMVEYGVRRPDVMVGGTIGGKPLTYVTDVRRTIATQGIWFPFHPVVTSDAEWRPLRGWDRTHEFDAAPELVETIYGGHNARVPGVDDRLENGVYSFQYHPELARDPSINDGKGTLDWVRYAINLAERLDFWIPSQKQIYHRMADYEELVLIKRDGGRQIEVFNPTARTIDAMVIEQRLPFASVWVDDTELIHVAREHWVTVPRLVAGQRVTLNFSDRESEAPILRKPSNKGLVVLDARHDPSDGVTRLLLSVCRAQALALESIDPQGVYELCVDDEPPQLMMPRTTRTIAALLSKRSDAGTAHKRRTRTPGVTRFLDLMIEGGANHFIERRVQIRALAGDAEHTARAMLIAAIPKRTGRVL